jgi:SNF2 family DNA or RNA helicase
MHMLYPHQRGGLEWFWSLHTIGMGGILGDDMGLGKTMQVYFTFVVFFPSSFMNENY